LEATSFYRLRGFYQSQKFLEVLQNEDTEAPEELREEEGEVRQEERLEADEVPAVGLAIVEEGAVSATVEVGVPQEAVADFVEEVEVSVVHSVQYISMKKQKS